MFQNPFDFFITGCSALMKHHLRRSVRAATMLLSKMFQNPFAVNGEWSIVNEKSGYSFPILSMLKCFKSLLEKVNGS